MRGFELMYYSPFTILCCMPSLPHYQLCSSNVKQKNFCKKDREHNGKNSMSRFLASFYANG